VQQSLGLGKLNDWWKGVVIKRDISGGMYDPEFISLQRLKELYGNGEAF